MVARRSPKAAPKRAARGKPRKRPDVRTDAEWVADLEKDATDGGNGQGETPEPDNPTATKTKGKTSAVSVKVFSGKTGKLDNYAGFLLGFLAWAWVGLPFLVGGPERVKDVLRVKFFNKGPDGKFLV